MTWFHRVKEDYRQLGTLFIPLFPLNEGMIEDLIREDPCMMDSIMHYINYIKNSDSSSSKDIVLDTDENIIFSRNKKMLLIDHKQELISHKEYLILDSLCSKIGEIVSVEELLNKVWGEFCIVGSDSLYVYINKIRKKIEKIPEDPRILQNKKGRGYTLVPSE